MPRATLSVRRAAPRPPLPRQRDPAAQAAAKEPVIPAESALIWGLLYDLIRAPAWAVLVLSGRARLGSGLLPARRIAGFVAAAPMTAVLIGLNLLCFGWELYEQHRGISQVAFLRRFALSPRDLLEGRLLPLMTHAFAHASPGHLFGNMLTLFVFGRIVERHLGPWRMLSAYLGAAAVSTALSLGAQVALHQDVPTLGASGAVAGMVALGILFSPFTLTFEALLPMPVLLLGWLAMAADLSGVLGARRDGIDHFAHIGGYLSVLVIVYGGLLDGDERRLLRAGLVLNLLSAAGCGLLWLLWLAPCFEHAGRHAGR